MNSFEFNKIFAAVLCAGILAMLGGFIGKELVHPHELEKNAVEIEGGELASGAPVKAQGPEPLLPLIASADIARGQKLSKACAACHSFNKGEPNKVGPNLWNVVGGPKAGKPGFSYSSGLSGVGGAWDYADLNKFLWKPKAYAAGIKMNFIGLKKTEDRAAVIAWLRTLSDSAMPMPSASDIAEEAAELAPPPEENSAEEEKNEPVEQETAH